ncbi:CLIP domain-containing serine protease B4 [Anabrus simplex]|uniref:CLIP domain-containing serine protease B4 n=1 Tax=Anabrus simplex TaxID=316456 RepID=UPI0035A2F181
MLQTLDWENLGVRHELLEAGCSELSGAKWREMSISRAFESMKVITLRSCPNDGDKCVDILACPYIAMRLVRRIPRERIRLLQNVSCRIEDGALDVCCPLPKIVMSNEEDLLRRHPSLSLLNEKECGKSRPYGDVREFPWLAVLMYEASVKRKILRAPQKRLVQERRLTQIPGPEGGSSRGASPARKKRSSISGRDEKTGSYQSRCGGSLISKRHVLTAAHCLLNSKKQALSLKKVRLGGFGHASEQQIVMYHGVPRYVSSMEYGVETVLPHREYDSFLQTNDIGLVTLRTDVYYSDFIQPICLPLPDSPAEKLHWESNMNLILAGWNLNDINNADYVSSDHRLRKSELEYLNPSECQNLLRVWISEVDSKQFCTRSRGRSICAGDSGGPIMRALSQYGSTVMYQIGIVSHTYGQCYKSAITLHTNIQPYLRWILDTIGNST